MKYPHYSNMRESNANWLGEIPFHWKQLRLKFVARFYGGATPSTTNDSYWFGNIPWVSPKDMKTLLIIDTEDHITQDAVNGSSINIVDPNNVLIVVRSGILRHSIPVAINGVAVTLNQDMKAIIPNRSLTSAYIKYVVLGCQDRLLLEWRKSGATVESLELEHIANTQWPLPPIDEQHSITSFLNAKTSDIDRLIALKERQIALLLKKRISLIDQVVGKGLDTQTPLRDSGVNWLGRVPESWQWRQLKTCVSYITSGSRGWASHYNFNGEGAVFVRIGNLTRHSIEIDFSDIQRVVPPPGVEGRRTRVRAGDVLISITAFPGSVGVVGGDIEEAYVNQHLALVRPRTEVVLPRWLGYCLLSRIGQVQFRLSAYGGAKEGLGLEDIASTYILVPPSLDEQRTIIAYLDRETERVDSLVAMINTQIKQLRIYRQALISAAVTGKIDVRNINIDTSEEV